MDLTHRNVNKTDRMEFSQLSSPKWPVVPLVGGGAGHVSHGGGEGAGVQTINWPIPVDLCCRLLSWFHEVISIGWKGRTYTWDTLLPSKCKGFLRWFSEISMWGCSLHGFKGRTYGNPWFLPTNGEVFCKFSHHLIPGDLPELYRYVLPACQACICPTGPTASASWDVKRASKYHCNLTWEAHGMVWMGLDGFGYWYAVVVFHVSWDTPSSTLAPRLIGNRHKHPG